VGAAVFLVVAQAAYLDHCPEHAAVILNNWNKFADGLKRVCWQKLLLLVWWALLLLLALQNS
jgi:hypothetical protein